MSALLDITVINRPEHAVEYLALLLKESTLPLEYVAKYDEPLLPNYPAAVVRSGQYTKEVHGTQTWLLTLRCEIYVMHARMTEDRATRNLEDLKLATKVVSLLERDKKLSGRVIFSHVENEVPGAMPPRSEKAAAVVSTRLAWQAITEARF
jgi:hypothetical protein